MHHPFGRRGLTLALTLCSARARRSRGGGDRARLGRDALMQRARLPRTLARRARQSRRERAEARSGPLGTCSKRNALGPPPPRDDARQQLARADGCPPLSQRRPSIQIEARLPSAHPFPGLPDRVLDQPKQAEWSCRDLADRFDARISWARWLERWAISSRGESGAGRDCSSSRCSSPCSLVFLRLCSGRNASSSFSRVAKNDSDTALSQQSPLRLILGRPPSCSSVERRAPEVAEVDRKPVGACGVSHRRIRGMDRPFLRRGGQAV
jgi:hypothetical protein